MSQEVSFNTIRTELMRSDKTREATEADLFIAEEVFIKDELIGYLSDYNNTMIFSTLSQEGNDAVIIVDDLESSSIYAFDMVYSEEFGYDMIKVFNEDDAQRTDMTACDVAFIANVAACVIGTIGIAASDGPLPFADALAATFYVACNTGATASYTSCREGED